MGCQDVQAVPRPFSPGAPQFAPHAWNPPAVQGPWCVPSWMASNLDGQLAGRAWEATCRRAATMLIEPSSASGQWPQRRQRLRPAWRLFIFCFKVAGIVADTYGLTALMMALCMPSAAWWVKRTVALVNPAEVRLSRYSCRDSAPAMQPT